MKIGVHASCTDETLRPDEVAVLVEQAGIDALHFGEHSHIPVGRGSESPADGGCPAIGRDFPTSSSH